MALQSGHTGNFDGSRPGIQTLPHRAITGSPVTASLADASSKRFRVLVLKQVGHADAGTCQDRALYERAHRAAKALETTYTVAGWRQSDGRCHHQQRQQR